jgi:hypothetical protein
MTYKFAKDIQNIYFTVEDIVLGVLYEMPIFNFYCSHLNWMLSALDVENWCVVEVSRKVVHIHCCRHNYNLNTTTTD